MRYGNRKRMMNCMGSLSQSSIKTISSEVNAVLFPSLLVVRANGRAIFAVSSSVEWCVRT